MTSRRTVVLLPVAAAALLAGCASAPQGSRVWRGRFALRALRPEGVVEALSGRFELTSAPDLLRLDLLTPLSGVLARIEETSSGASMRRNLTDEPVADRDLDALTQRLLGFPVPVRELLALLEAGASAPAESSPAGWRCGVLARNASGAPARIRIERAAVPALTLTVLVEENPL